MIIYFFSKQLALCPPQNVRNMTIWESKILEGSKIFMPLKYRVSQKKYTSLNSGISKLNFEVEASEVLVSSQAHFVMCLVERGFISKLNI